MIDLLKINNLDNVAVAVNSLNAGTKSELIEGGTVKEDIKAGHKVALSNIKKGEKVIKYGYQIGVANADIKAGEFVHSHNLKSVISGTQNYTYNKSTVELTPKKADTFMGFVRENGNVGCRNEVWIIPTVGCVNPIVKEMEKRAQKYVGGSIDSITAYTHPYGCSQLGDDMARTLDFLCGLIRHPNAAGVLVVGLGCENGNIAELKKHLGEYNENRVKFLNCQDFEDEFAKADNLLKKLTDYAKGFTRTVCNADKLVIGLKCGGSDGFSGLTANALVGSFSDLLISMGGSTLLTEVPEMFGAEHILMNRATNKDVFLKEVDLINNFKKYFIKYGEKTDENPSPGNKEGGITTLAEKSLGCVQKGGSAPVADVLAYGQKVKESGLSLVNGPGNDLVATGALVAAGAQIVLFTTGRGTPFCCPVPTVKISSNTPLYNKKSAWIDFNAGELLNGKSIEDLTTEFKNLIFDIASGKKTAKSEAFEKNELAIFKDGVTL